MKHGEYPGPPDLTMGEHPHATVLRTSWCTWSITIHHGILRWGPDGGDFTAFGTEEMAVRRAERLLHRYERKLERDHDRRDEQLHIEL